MSGTLHLISKYKVILFQRLYDAKLCKISSLNITLLHSVALTLLPILQYREHSKNARHTGASELKLSQEKLKNNFALLEQSETTNKALQNELKIAQAEANELKARVRYLE